MSNTDAIKHTVKDYILREFLIGESPSALTDSTPLISGGILDSIGTIKLVTFLEDNFNIKFQSHETGKDFLDNLSRIAQSVASKLAAKA